jgi:hypothetical protein
VRRLGLLRAVRLPVGGLGLPVGAVLAERWLLAGRRERRRRLSRVRLLRLGELRLCISRPLLLARVLLTGLGLAAVVLLGRHVGRRDLGLVARPPYLLRRRVRLLLAGRGHDVGLLGIPRLLPAPRDDLRDFACLAGILLGRRLGRAALRQVHLAAAVTLGGLARVLLGHLARFGRVPLRLRDYASLLAGPRLAIRLGPPSAGRLLLAPRGLLDGLLRRTVRWLRSLWRTHRGPSPWRRAVARSKHRSRSGHRGGCPRPFTRYPRQRLRGGSS